MCHFVIQFLKGSSVDLTKYTLSALKKNSASLFENYGNLDVN